MSLGIAGLAYRRHSLSESGFWGAILTGTITFKAGAAWALILILFFVSSSALSKISSRRKSQAREQFSKGERRDFWQVMANGGAAAFFALLYIRSQSPALWVAYLAAVAVATADTWATEIGTLSHQNPRLITTFKPVLPGTSGGVTPAGMLASPGGAFLIGAVGALMLDAGIAGYALVILITMAGFSGSLFDSFLGATVQAVYWCEDHQRLTEKQICSDGNPAVLRRGFAFFNNEMVNFAATVAGGVIVFFVVSL